MTTDTVIRPATADDLSACAAIINDYIDATDWLPRIHSRDQLANFFAPELLDRRTVLVAEKGSAIVGYMTMSGEGLVPALYLAPHARGYGIGVELLDHAKALAAGRVELTVFEPNIAARRFYEREGFAEVAGSRSIADEGIPIITLRWEAAA